MAEWDAEVVVSAADVAAIIGAQYAEFRDSRVDAYAEGWDNAGFLVDGAVLFRFPRRAIAVDLLTREIALLPRMAGYDVPSGVLRWFDDHPPRLDERRTFVHGDLYARHVLLDADGGACGVIDWGDMHYGTPAIDLAAAHTMLSPEAHAAFRAAYGAVDDAVWSAARWRGVYSALVALEYGITAGAEDMRRCGAAALRLIARAVGDAPDDQAGK